MNFFLYTHSLILTTKLISIKIKIADEENQRHQSLDPPYRLEFPPAKPSNDEEAITITAKSYSAPNRGPYPYCEAKKNSVPFTPTQVEAIRAGMQPGLTMIVGPPGTGKTDVAVQIISNIYHNFPEQRTCIVTHSNQERFYRSIRVERSAGKVPGTIIFCRNIR